MNTIPGIVRGVRKTSVPRKQLRCGSTQTPSSSTLKGQSSAKVISAVRVSHGAVLFYGPDLQPIFVMVMCL